MGVYIHLLVALLARLVLCLYAEYHDSSFTVKYTDIDYQIFTDGASHLAAGRSPYNRDTYRYSPLVAYVMLPNVLYHPMCGKIILCLADVLAGFLIYRIVAGAKAKSKLQDMRKSAQTAALFWLYNPFTIAISSRGSFEPIQCCLVHLSLYLALKRRYLLCGLAWGFSVHTKMYTIVYGLSFYIWANIYGKESGLRDMVVPNLSRVMLGIGAMLGFGIPTGWFYIEYGYEFLYETFLYHLNRVDTQHNFSPVFYPMRLLSESPSTENDIIRQVISSTCLLLQMILVIRTSFRYAASHLSFALFTQTCYFVIFNKVATSQYFTWYLCLLPLVLHRLPYRRSAWIFFFLAWIGAQGNWLLQAYYFEFENADNLLYVFIASIIYVISHTALLVGMIRKYDGVLEAESKIL